MFKQDGVLIAAFCLALTVTVPAVGWAQNPSKTRATPSAADKDNENGIARFCAVAVPKAQEARLAWQMQRLSELDGRLQKRITDLVEAEKGARDWAQRRDKMLKAASDNTVAIYAKMPPEAAASQIASMDDIMAASILSKLNPRSAGLILAEMEATRAGKLMNLVAGLGRDDKKS